MDPEEFAALMANLDLREEEEGGTLEIVEEEFEEVDAELECQVACKIFAEIHSSSDVFKKLIPRIWNVENKLEVESVGKNVFVCTFVNKVLKEKIVESSPWIYDNAVLLFEDMSGGKRVSEMEFVTAAFWVRIHDVPPICHTEKMVVKLGNLVGVFINWDKESGKRNKGKFVRIKVALDVSRPLRRAVKVKCGAMAPEKWARVSYERLPVFCRGCGRIGHAVADCDFVVVGDGNPFPFGEEMREPLPVFRGDWQNQVVGRFGGRGRGRGRGRGGWWRREEGNDEGGGFNGAERGGGADEGGGDLAGAAEAGGEEVGNGRVAGEGTTVFRTGARGQNYNQRMGQTFVENRKSRALGEGTSGEKTVFDKGANGAKETGIFGPAAESNSWLVGQEDLLFGPMEISCAATVGPRGASNFVEVGVGGLGGQQVVEANMAQFLKEAGLMGKEKGVVFREPQVGPIKKKGLGYSGKGKKVVDAEEGEVRSLPDFGRNIAEESVEISELQVEKDDSMESETVATAGSEIDETGCKGNPESAKAGAVTTKGINLKKRAREVRGTDQTGDVKGSGGVTEECGVGGEGTGEGKRLKTSYIDSINGISAEAAEQSRRMQ